MTYDTFDYHVALCYVVIPWINKQTEHAVDLYFEVTTRTRSHLCGEHRRTATSQLWIVTCGRLKQTRARTNKWTTDNDSKQLHLRAPWNDSENEGDPNCVWQGKALHWKKDCSESRGCLQSDVSDSAPGQPVGEWTRMRNSRAQFMEKDSGDLNGILERSQLCSWTAVRERSWTNLWWGLWRQNVCFCVSEGWWTSVRERLSASVIQIIPRVNMYVYMK